MQFLSMDYNYTTSQKAIDDYVENVEQQTLSGQEPKKGEKWRLVVTSDDKGQHLQCCKEKEIKKYVGRIDRVLSWFGFGKASLKGVVNFCSKYGVWNDKIVETSLSAKKSGDTKKSGWSKIDTATRNVL